MAPEARYLSMFKSEVDANMLPTLISEPCPNKTPDGLSRKIVPFAVSLPKISEGPLAAFILFIATELELGCKKLTCSFELILKLCQFNTALLEFWLICILLGPVVMLAEPSVTTPPRGNPLDSMLIPVKMTTNVQKPTMILKYDVILSGFLYICHPACFSNLMV